MNAPVPTGEPASVGSATLPAPPDPAPVISSAQAAVADMRATARWTIGATAAVGGLLLGGVPLAAIGKARGIAEITLAASGLVLALAGVAVVIWRTQEVLMPRFVTLRALEEPELAGLRREIAAAPEAFFGPFGRSADELDRACRLHATVAAGLTDLLARERDEDRRAAAAHSLASARANLAHASARRRTLLELVHAWQVSRALRRARLETLLGSLVVVAGALLFLLATGR
ncbi:hypothetical protein [Streptomyces sp. NPDC102476]|uniref:hypothetical protein n=1 Tax=Streptomyces sp. NPDC102476 TaxID=3366181 RepID=UPI00381B94FB